MPHEEEQLYKVVIQPADDSADISLPDVKFPLRQGVLEKIEGVRTTCSMMYVKFELFSNRVCLLFVFPPV